MDVGVGVGGGGGGRGLDVPGRGAGTPRRDEHLRSNGTRVLKRDRASALSTPDENASNKAVSRASSQSPKDDAKPNGSDHGLSTPDAAKPPPPRKSSTRAAPAARAPPKLFGDLPDATQDACSSFQVINDCLYGSRNMGASEHESLDCDCAEEWNNSRNDACGEDSDCINRATKIECVDGECNCGSGCQNQRFQRKQYADVSVFKTEKKGFGLRANAPLQPHDFIFEYLGEVINEPTFRNRMVKYDREGIKHFYFMSLTKSEFVDATKKGNLGRFCNHSCRPNCYVDKWVVGGKLRMGIFTSRPVQAGEELVFNYNVDRYGADPQPCYCGEPNCTGYIGGKTQTERATKLPQATIEALGIDDGDGWDTAVAKKPRKKKAAEEDEDYVNGMQPRGLDEDGVNKVMATLMQCKEKWIAVKLLTRLQQADSHLRHRVVKMHGYQILKTILNAFKDDTNVVLQVLNILYNLPRITKNKISDSKIEAAIEPLTRSDRENVSFESKRLLDEWSKLETAYRIPRKKLDPNAGPATAAASTGASSYEEERRVREDSAKSSTVLLNINPVNIPTGPRSSIPQRMMHVNGNGYFGGHGQRPPKKLPSNLPPGWYVTTDSTGKYYFYDKNGKVQWQRPTAPAMDAAPTPSARAEQDQKALQNIIDSLTKEPTPRPLHSASQTPRQASSTPGPASVSLPAELLAKRERWRAFPVEKQMKIYENTLFPHVKYVMDKFHHKLPREDLKRLAREANKNLVSSDYRHQRVDDPTAPLSPRRERKVKDFVKNYLTRAVVKMRNLDTQKDKETAAGATNGRNETVLVGVTAERVLPEGGARTGVDDGADQEAKPSQPDSTPMQADMDMDMEDDAAASVLLSDEEDGTTPSTGASERKRKRVAFEADDRDDGSGGNLVVGPETSPAATFVATATATADAAAAAAAADGGLLGDESTNHIAKRPREKENNNDDNDEDNMATPPPPPPPPISEEERSMREQEEALMRENEEAQRLEDEAKGHDQHQDQKPQVSTRQNGNGAAKEGRENGKPEGVATDGDAMDLDSSSDE